MKLFLVFFLLGVGCVVGKSQKNAITGNYCWDIDNDAICDPAIEDRNGDGDCNVQDCPNEPREKDAADPQKDGEAPSHVYNWTVLQECIFFITVLLSSCTAAIILVMIVVDDATPAELLQELYFLLTRSTKLVFHDDDDGSSHTLTVLFNGVTASNPKHPLEEIKRIDQFLISTDNSSKTSDLTFLPLENAIALNVSIYHLYPKTNSMHRIRARKGEMFVWLRHVKPTDTKEDELHKVAVNSYLQGEDLSKSPTKGLFFVSLDGKETPVNPRDFLWDILDLDDDATPRDPLSEIPLLIRPYKHSDISVSN